MLIVEKLLFGCAYYDEYMPEDRLCKDIQMMLEAGINVIRIAESTWAAEEPEDGVFDFTHVQRVLDATKDTGISVIIGTPTYAFPPWLAQKCPQVLAVTPKGRGKYGARQIMDITHPAFRYHAERIIRKLMECVQPYPHVIGFQLDNETKHYHTSGENVQRAFVRHLCRTFSTTEAMNEAFGFQYWSNAVDAWENVPDPTGTINGSFAAEFSKFQRSLVDEYLSWQADIVREYVRPDQFITHNFDFAWRNHSFGVQPDVNHKTASRVLTIAGCDIYHRSQDQLTGKEAAFCGDLTRGLKRDNYLVLETQAQGFPEWLPYPGQLRLQAFSHLASGANSVMYWHWHSIHNACETYWKGILSHDLAPNRVYREAITIGRDFARLSKHLVNLKKENKVAMLVSNESLTALELFPFPTGLSGEKTGYNDILRRWWDAMYDMNIPCDILFPDDAEVFGKYAMLLAPALYSAPDSLLNVLCNYVQAGGTLVTGFKSGFTNEHVKVSHQAQPHILHECCGITYDEFTTPVQVGIDGADLGLTSEGCQAEIWMELVRPTGAKALATYCHPYWKDSAAITENTSGKGTAFYIGCHMSLDAYKAIFTYALKKTGLWGIEQNAAFPLVIRSGVNELNRKVLFYFNYSGETVEQAYLHRDGLELVSGAAVHEGELLKLPPWGFAIIEELQAAEHN